MRRAPNPFAGISGDPEADDALLSAIPTTFDAMDAILNQPQVLDDRAEHLTAAYERWIRRPASDAPGQQEFEIAGALGFCVLTHRMLACTIGVGGAPASRRDWPARLQELN